MNRGFLSQYSYENIFRSGVLRRICFSCVCGHPQATQHMYVGQETTGASWFLLPCASQGGTQVTSLHPQSPSIIPWLWCSLANVRSVFNGEHGKELDNWKSPTNFSTDGCLSLAVRQYSNFFATQTYCIQMIFCMIKLKIPFSSENTLCL